MSRSERKYLRRIARLHAAGDYDTSMRVAVASLRATEPSARRFGGMLVAELTKRNRSAPLDVLFNSDPVQDGPAS